MNYKKNNKDNRLIKNNKMYLYDKIFFFITFISISILYFSGELESKILLIYSIIINIYIIVKYRGNTIVLFIFILFLSILLYLLPTYFYGIKLSVYSFYDDQMLYDKVLYIQTFFMICFKLVMPRKNSKYVPLKNIIKTYDNNFIFYGAFIISMFSIIFIIRGNVVLFSSSGYDMYVDNLNMRGSSIIEYLIVLFIIMFLFSKTKIKRLLLLVLVSVYILKLMLLGYRIQSLMGLIFIYMIYIDGYFNYKVVLSGVIFMFLFMVIFGELKHGFSNFEVSNLFYDANVGYVESHQTDVFYSATVFVAYVRDGIIGGMQRILAGIGLLLNMIIPSGLVAKFIPVSRLGTWGRQFSVYGGGNLPSIYLYTCFSYIGVLGLSILLSKYVTFSYSLNKNKVKNASIIYLLTITIMSPRWVFYDVGNFLFRLPIMTIIIYLVCLILHRHKYKNIK